MSTSVWDGGCWIVVDVEGTVVDGEHRPTEANAHAISKPAGLYVRREDCNCNANWPAPKLLPAGTPVHHVSQEWAHGQATAVITAVRGPFFDLSYEYEVQAGEDFSRPVGPDNPMTRSTWWSSLATAAARAVGE